MSSPDGKRLANLVNCAGDGTAADPSISFAGSFLNSTGTGIYGTDSAINQSVGGTLKSALSSTLLTLAVSLSMSNDVVLLTKAGVPVDGGAGTGVGVAGPGSICVDYTNANLYVNGNTKASPTWKLVTRAA